MHETFKQIYFTTQYIGGFPTSNTKTSNTDTGCVFFPIE